MKQYLCPSIMCGDLLNLEREIRTLEKGRADLIHFDMMDTTFTVQTMLPAILIPQIRKATQIPLDIHVMIRNPETFLDELLKSCKGCFVQLHIESTNRINLLLEKIREAGAYPGIALNSGTPLSLLEETVPHVELINVILGNAGLGAQRLDAQLLDTVKRARALADSAGKKDMVIQVDGGVSFETALAVQREGANAYVLGTKSIYGQERGTEEKLDELRMLLEA